MSHILTQANSLACVLLIPCPPSFLVALAVIPSLLNANLKHLEWAWQQGNSLGPSNLKKLLMYF